MGPKQVAFISLAGLALLMRESAVGRRQPELFWVGRGAGGILGNRYRAVD